MKKDNIQQIYFKITNNTSEDVDLNILGDPWGPNSPQINADIRFDFNLSTETFIGLTSWQMPIGPTDSGPFTLYTKPFTGTTIQELADSLTSLGFGKFYVSGTTLYTYSSGNFYIDSLTLT